VLFGCYLCCSMYCLCVNVYCHRVTTQLQLINKYYIIKPEPNKPTGRKKFWEILTYKYGWRYKSSTHAHYRTTVIRPILWTVVKLVNLSAVGDTTFDCGRWGCTTTVSVLLLKQPTFFVRKVTRPPVCMSLCTPLLCCRVIKKTQAAVGSRLRVWTTPAAV